MAIDIYLSIPGLTDENGTAQPGGVVIGSAPYVQVSSFSFGVVNTGAAQTGAPNTGAGAGKAEFSDLSVVLPVGFSTPPLFRAAAAGTVFQHATLIVQSGGPGGPGSPGGPGGQVTTQKYDLTEVVAVSLAVTGSASGDQQSLTLRYGAIQITYTPLDAKGNAGTPSTGGYDLTTNKAI